MHSQSVRPLAVPTALQAPGLSLHALTIPPMLGTLIGDIIGSVYEFKNLQRKDFAPLFHPQARFTDDTVCTVAVADALVRGADPQATLIDWCRRHAENGGWGKRFAE